MKTTAVLIVLLCLQAGCTRARSIKEAIPARAQFEGNLVDKSEDIYSPNNKLYSCDTQLKNKVIEVSKAVEKNRQNIEKMISERNKLTSNGEKFTVGGIDFFHRDKPTGIADEWIAEEVGWNKIYDQYLEIKDDPLNPLWRRLNSEVRSIIVDDESRIKWAAHPGVRQSEEKNVLETLSALESCLENETCLNVELSANNEAWLREGLSQSAGLDILRDSSTSDGTKRTVIQVLANNIRGSGKGFVVYKNPTIQVYNKSLIVPMNFEVFGSEKETIIKMLSDAWTAHGLEINFVHTVAPDSYKIKLKYEPGERDYVAHDLKEMILFPVIDTTTIKHEAGHILGLKDTYFNSFDQTKCTYKIEYNKKDMMSYPMTGEVLPLHIEKIKKIYSLE